ncbi:hypothetical protein FACS1894155_07230 [Bacteroidia bacterium]|nr:hypothetical protein FACS1894155_07230 [Bacteroidia bacterium]
MLHYFNPGNEAAVLNASPYYTLPANPAKMQRDLFYLPAWYGEKDDFVLVGNALGQEYPEMLRPFYSLPEAITIEEFEKKRNLLNGTEVVLWGMSPQSLHLFEQWNEKYNLNLKIPLPNESYSRLVSRRTARTCLSGLLENIPELSHELLPGFYSSHGIIKQKLEESNVPMLVKAPYSSSGRGLLWVQHPLDRASSQILQGMLNKQREVSLEKALDKQTDFAMLFYSNPDGTVDFKAYSLFHTDNKGNYKGNFVGSQEKIKSELFSSVDEILLEKTKKQLISIFNAQFSSIYQGCICVDMMLYRENGNIRLHPCVEINFRYTMGWLAMKLYQYYFAEHTSGSFQIEFQKDPEKLYEKHLQMMDSYPLVTENGRIVSGYLPLCPVTKDTNFSAFVVTK